MRIAWTAPSALLLAACSTVAPLDTEAMTTSSDDANTAPAESPTTDGAATTGGSSASQTEASADPTTLTGETGQATTMPQGETSGTTTAEGTTTLQETTIDSNSSGGDDDTSTGEPAPGCENGLPDPGESDVDCGGPCSPCDDGQSCLDAADCNSGVCTDMACAAAACDDGVQNQDESDVDCGGAACDPCADGQSCLVADDCASGVCEADKCVAATCSDAVQNGDETGLDCGGPTCAPCELPGLVLNEVDYDNVGTDSAEFVEVYNNTGTAVDLANIRLYIVNGSNNNVLTTVSLAPAGVLAQGQYLVVGPPNLVVAMGALKVDFAKASDNLQNDSEGLALVDVGGPTVQDVLSYEGSITMANLPNLPGTTLVEGTAFSDADSNTTQRSLARFPTGNDKDDAATDWVLSKTPTPGAANVL